MSTEENKAIVKKWEDALSTCDEETIKSTAKEVFAPEFSRGYKMATPERQGEIMAGFLKNTNPKEFKRDVKIVYRFAEDDCVVNMLDMKLNYKDKTWGFPVTRFELFRIQNGKIVEYRGADNRLHLREQIDKGQIS